MSATTTDDRVNMVPLIDTMFFIIVFFLLVMKFPLAEKAIAQLLPTDQGQHNDGKPPPPIAPQDPIRISIYPTGMQRGTQASALGRQWQAHDNASDAYTICISGHQPLRCAAGDLQALNSYLQSALRDLEDPAEPARKKQLPIELHCFSGMPWNAALQAYDAVRDYEANRNITHQINHDYNDLLAARAVSFAPPRLRDYQPNALGQELFEIINQR